MNWIYSLAALRSEATEWDRSGRWGYNAQTGGVAVPNRTSPGVMNGRGSDITPYVHILKGVWSLDWKMEMVKFFTEQPQLCLWNEVGPETSVFLPGVSMWNKRPWIISQPSRKHLFNGLRTIISPQLLTPKKIILFFRLYHANWISTYTFNCYSYWKLQKR